MYPATVESLRHWVKPVVPSKTKEDSQWATAREASCSISTLKVYKFIVRCEFRHFIGEDIGHIALVGFKRSISGLSHSAKSIIELPRGMNISRVALGEVD